MKSLSKIVLWFVAMLCGVMFVGCISSPLLSIDASDNTMNVGKYRQDHVINFRSKR